ncbi:UNVERIFIED_CONTAM: hypothetical protein Sindi_1966700, partial [Sesamum indicum]
LLFFLERGWVATRFHYFSPLPMTYRGGHLPSTHYPPGWKACLGLGEQNRGEK